jgi:hypothetical protein
VQRKKNHLRSKQKYQQHEQRHNVVSGGGQRQQLGPAHTTPGPWLTIRGDTRVRGDTHDRGHISTHVVQTQYTFGTHGHTEAHLKAHTEAHTGHTQRHTKRHTQGTHRGTLTGTHRGTHRAHTQAHTRHSLRHM